MSLALNVEVKSVTLFKFFYIFALQATTMKKGRRTMNRIEMNILYALCLTALIVFGTSATEAVSSAPKPCKVSGDDISKPKSKDDNGAKEIYGLIACGKNGLFCADDQTCCMMKDKSWGCCPYRNAVCCDNGSCCKSGKYCCSTGDGCCDP